MSTYFQHKSGAIYEVNYPNSSYETDKDMKRVTKKYAIEKDRENAIKALKKILKPGDTVYTILRHVSRSGMMRHISLIAGKDSHDITYLAAKAMNDKIAKDGGIKTPGCGMDMGFHLVYNLGYTLWPKGTPKPHGTRNGEPDSDGGYALNQRWL
jgi:hypothetical protein